MAVTPNKAFTLPKSKRLSRSSSPRFHISVACKYFCCSDFPSIIPASPNHRLALSDNRKYTVTISNKTISCRPLHQHWQRPNARNTKLNTSTCKTPRQPTFLAPNAYAALPNDDLITFGRYPTPWKLDTTATGNYAGPSTRVHNKQAVPPNKKLQLAFEMELQCNKSEEQHFPLTIFHP